MEQSLNLGKFISLKQQEINSESNELIEKLGICTQSISRWLQYCEYHYMNFKSASKDENLKLDSFSVYRRAGEAVSIRCVYEANIAAFLNNLHALLDSFPYLLNLFIKVVDDPNSTSIKWHEDFINKYQVMSFYDELMDFMLNLNFHKTKGYVNTIKHKHLIRILNKRDHLEFEEYSYKQPHLDKDGKLCFQNKVVAGDNILSFIEQCHDELIPKFFTLCDNILNFKASQLANDL